MTISSCIGTFAAFPERVPAPDVASSLYLHVNTIPVWVCASATDCQRFARSFKASTAANANAIAQSAPSFVRCSQRVWKSSRFKGSCGFRRTCISQEAGGWMEKCGIRAASQEAYTCLQRSHVVCGALTREKPSAKSHPIPFRLGRTEREPESHEAIPRDKYATSAAGYEALRCATATHQADLGAWCW